MAVQVWYNETTLGQKILMFVVSVILSLWLFGLVPLLFLVFLELGRRRR